MALLKRLITRTLSIRLSLMVVFAITILLMATLSVMFLYARKVVKIESLKKAKQTLEGTVQHIDNTLLKVETAANTMLWNVEHHLDDPDLMFEYSQKLLELNPDIAGCAIAFEPYYYKDKGQYFMAYCHRQTALGKTNADSPIIRSNVFGNRPYFEQAWYTIPVETGKAFWTEPLKDDETEDEALTSYCLPIRDASGRTAGVLGVDLSLSLFTQTVLAVKPSPNSYCTLLGTDGSYIIHPDSNKLFHQNIFQQTQTDSDPTVKEAAMAMVSGKSDYRLIKLNGNDCYVFFQPFTRHGWSVGIIYPKEDIFGDYNQLFRYILIIVAASLVLLMVLCLTVTHRQLLPLRLLTQSAQRIADGHYDEPIPDSHQEDEIGRLQDNFQQMQQSLATHVSELKRLTATLQERGEVLRTAYDQAQEADRMKTAFLHNMTNQMAIPVSTISEDVKELHESYRDMDQEKANHLVDDIQQQGEKVTNLLNHMLDVSQGIKSEYQDESKIGNG